MKKTICCFFAALLTILFLALTQFSVNGYESDNIISEAVNPQQPACDAHQRLLASFEEAEYGFIYPEDFGGDYIEDNTLHVCLTSCDTDTVNSYKAIIGDIPCVIYEEATYNLNDLIGLKDDIFDYLTENNIEVYFAAPSEITNSINIEVDESDIGAARILSANYLLQTAVPYSNSQGSGLSELLDIKTGAPSVFSDAAEEVDFSDYMTSAAAGTVVVAGSRLYTSGSFNRTLAATGSRNTKITFLTCGHSTTEGQRFTSSTGTVYGDVTYYQFDNNNYGDFSFITAESGFTTTQRVWTGGGTYTTLSGTLDLPAVGTNLYRFGAVTLQTDVTVSATNSTVVFSGTGAIKGMCRAISEDPSIPGDSGGPYRQGNLFCGIHTGNLL